MMLWTTRSNSSPLQPSRTPAIRRRITDDPNILHRPPPRRPRAARKFGARARRQRGDLTDRTTHLVATKIHPRSAKLACALKLGLPIVLPQWVHASGAAGEPLPLGPHHVPPALSASCSPSTATTASPRRTRAAAGLVQSAGGRFSVAIDETVTHVLAHEVGRAEDPLARASAGAVLVRPEWLRESVRLGRLQDEGRYAVPHAQPPPRLLAADSTRVAETPAPAPLGDATSLTVNHRGQPMPAPPPKKARFASVAPAVIRDGVGAGASGVVRAPLALLRAAALIGKLPLKEDLSVQSAGPHRRRDVRHRRADGHGAEDDVGDEVYTLKELLFALQNAHLEHSAYFLACVTQRIKPVLLLDKRKLLQVIAPADGAGVSTSAAARLAAGPLAPATAAALGPASATMQAAASAASATVQAVAAAHDRAQQEKIRELQAACCAHAATVDELAGQLATERFRAGAAADQVLDVLAAVAVDWE